jgi:6-phosphogluconolactonase
MERRRHYIYPDKDALVAAFVCEVSNFLRESASLKRPVHLALSGGSTPLAVFRQISEATPMNDWSHVHLYWGDERCVEPDDPESNYGNARSAFLDPLGLNPEQIHRIQGESEPAREAGRYGDLLKKSLPLDQGVPVFDWVWLGLGEDGHTASIFPQEIKLWGDTEPCVVARHPQTGQRRISITGTVINAARRVSFLVSGDSKAQIVNEIVMKEGKFMDYPAFYVAPASGNLEWYMDQDATNWL